MGYNKIIQYGNKVEIYEYAREPRVVDRRGRVPRTDEANTSNVDLGADGADSVSQRKLGKRQDNSRRAKLDFRRLVEANLVGAELPVLFTFTCKDNITDLSYGYKCLRSFNQALRYSYGKSFRYIVVPEFQKRGAVHFHALFWGLPTEVYVQERQTRTIAGLWGHGFIYLKETDGDEKLSKYLAKYMAKAFTDRRLKNKKAYVASRNVKRPIIQKWVGYSSWAVLEANVGDAPPVSDREYQSHWLGKCRQRIFKTSNE